MRLKTIVVLIGIAVIAAASSAFSASRLGNTSGAQHGSSSKEKSDPISGEWVGQFEVQGNTVSVTFSFKLDGDKVTGKLESAHTGPGTVNKGQWADSKLSFTADFASHESIDITGSLKDGKLSGEFRTEGNVGKWEAKKK